MCNFPFNYHFFLCRTTFRKENRVLQKTKSKRVGKSYRLRSSKAAKRDVLMHDRARARVIGKKRVLCIEYSICAFVSVLYACIKYKRIHNNTDKGKSFQ